MPLGIVVLDQARALDGHALADLRSAPRSSPHAMRRADVLGAARSNAAASHRPWPPLRGRHAPGIE